MVDLSVRRQGEEWKSTLTTLKRGSLYYKDIFLCSSNTVNLITSLITLLAWHWKALQKFIFSYLCERKIYFLGEIWLMGTNFLLFESKCILLISSWRILNFWRAFLLTLYHGGLEFVKVGVLWNFRGQESFSWLRISHQKQKWEQCLLIFNYYCSLLIFLPKRRLSII